MSTTSWSIWTSFFYSKPRAPALLIIVFFVGGGGDFAAGLGSKEKLKPWGAGDQGKDTWELSWYGEQVIGNAECITGARGGVGIHAGAGTITSSGDAGGRCGRRVQGWRSHKSAWRLRPECQAMEGAGCHDLRAWGATRTGTGGQQGRAEKSTLTSL